MLKRRLNFRRKGVKMKRDRILLILVIFLSFSQLKAQNNDANSVNPPPGTTPPAPVNPTSGTPPPSETSQTQTPLPQGTTPPPSGTNPPADTSGLPPQTNPTDATSNINQNNQQATQQPSNQPQTLPNSSQVLPQPPQTNAPNPTDANTPPPMLVVPSSTGAEGRDALMQKVQKGPEKVEKPDPIRTASVMDELFLDYKKSKSFADFLKKMNSKVLPGDDILIAKKINLYPELLKVKKLPEITIEKEQRMVIRSGKGESIIRISDIDTFDFEINRVNVAFRPYINSGIRWSRVTDAMLQSSQNQSMISFMPVAFASENADVPTITEIVVYSMLSRIVRSLTKLDAQIVVDNTYFSYSDIWKKSIEFKSVCSNNYMYHLAQRMAEVGVTSIRCEGQTAVIEMPFSDTAKRIYEVNPVKREIVCKGAGLEKPLLFHRNFIKDPDLDFSIYEYNDGTGSKIEKKHEKRSIAQRMKGLKWRPVGKSSEEDLDTGEHIRELANIVLSGKLCRRCNLFFKHAAKIIKQETDPESLKSANLNMNGTFKKEIRTDEDKNLNSNPGSAPVHR